MSKTTTAKTLAPEDVPDAGQAGSAAAGHVEKAAPQAPTTPASGGRYKRAEDGTLTPIEE